MPESQTWVLQLGGVSGHGTHSSCLLKMRASSSMADIAKAAMLKNISSVCMCVCVYQEETSTSNPSNTWRRGFCSVQRLLLPNAMSNGLLVPGFRSENASKNKSDPVEINAVGTDKAVCRMENTVYGIFNCWVRSARKGRRL